MSGNTWRGARLGDHGGSGGSVGGGAGSRSAILTVQAGRAANYVGAHWWNIQDDAFGYNEEPGVDQHVSSSMVFREGLDDHRRVTYLPRLVAIDKKGALGTLCRDGTTSDGAATEVDPSLWDGNVRVVEQERIEKNAFLLSLEDGDGSEDGGSADGGNAVGTSSQAVATTTHDGKNGDDGDSDDDDGITIEEEASADEAVAASLGLKQHDLSGEVRYWSDYLRSELHSRSLWELTSVHDGIHAFDTYPAGMASLVADRNERDEVETLLHNFAEECDSIQGFHLMLDGSDAFAGVGAALVDLIRDDYEKTPILAGVVFPGTPDGAQVDDLDRVALNRALVYERLADRGAFFVPLDVDYMCASRGSLFRGLALDPSDLYQTTALLGAGWDTVTLPYRRPGRTTNLAALLQTLRPSASTHMGALSMMLPLPQTLSGLGALFEADDLYCAPELVAPTLGRLQTDPDLTVPLSQVVVWRQSPSPASAPLPDNPQVGLWSEVGLASGGGSGGGSGDRGQAGAALASTYDVRASFVETIPFSLPIPQSFPDIFTAGSEPVREAVAVNDRGMGSLAMMAQIQTSEAVGANLTVLCDHVRRAKPARHTGFDGLTKDDWIETEQRLREMAGLYSTADDY